ncbi:MAG: glycerol-phosphatase [Pseudonocardiales bacterium]|nr:glycerol-phosphatase [Pseudonocardiales bacterium]
MRPVPRYLRGSARPLTELYDVALLDLDGVVYVGPDAVPGAPEALAAARAAGMRLAFVTNNAARPPHVVADHLTELGIAAKAPEIVTSAQAAARYLADRLPGGARVLVLGTTGLEQALQERGLIPVSDAEGQVDAVVQGYSPDMNWRLLAEGAVAINRRVLWVATNVDPTVPSPRGPLPGNGSLVAALRLATGREPVVTGKPDPTMHRESLLRSEARDPIVVGDRLDTDIEGANAVGCDSLLVLSGVTRALEAIEAPPKLRPTYLGWDVGALLVAQPEPRILDDGAVCGGWQAARVDSRGHPGLTLRKMAARAVGSSETEQRASDLDAWRALCAAAWAAHPDSAATGLRVDQAGGADHDDDEVAAVIDRLGLG